jgi:VWFA-related protein
MMAAAFGPGNGVLMLGALRMQAPVEYQGPVPNPSRAAIVAALLGLSLVRPAAQQQQQPVFRAAAHYVSVDVVVTDRDDQPVTDLTVDDFEIVENGRRQVITDFAFVHVPVAHRDIDPDAPPSPPIDVASNGELARASRAIAILVDDSSLSTVLFCEGCPDVLVSLKSALTRFLQSLSSDDQVAIVWQGRSDLSQDFTNDIPRLIAAVKGYRAAIGLTPLGPAFRPRVNSLKFAVDALAGSRVARRAIVFVGVAACNPIGEYYFEGEECRDLYKRAREANVPIYTLDPRVNPPGMSDNMVELSLNTGGLSFQRLSKPLVAVDQILTDTGSFYSLGFYPDPLVADGKYHEFKVNVRRQGVRVRARDRYLADKAVKPASTPNRNMTAALGAGVADPSLPIRAVAAPLEPAPGGRVRTLVTIEVGYPPPEPSQMAWKDDVRVGLLALSPDAKIRASFQRPLTFTGQWQRTDRATFVLNETIDLPTEALTLRVGVTSTALAVTGTAHLRIDVPDIRASRLVLTPLVLGLSSAGSDASTGLDLLRALVPFQPTTQRAFSRDDTLHVYGRAYWGGSDATLPFEIAISDANAPVHRTETAASSTTSAGRRRAALDTSVPLSTLSAGPHVLTVTAHVGRDKPVRREIPFVVK